MGTIDHALCRLSIGFTLGYLARVGARPSYDFEGADHRSAERARAYADVFMARLGADRGVLDADGQRALDDFATEVHLNIAWYGRRLGRERWRWRLLVAVTFALVPLIPLAIYWAARDAATAPQVMAALTGLFALHRSAVATLDQRARFAIFHQARSGLKDLLYRTEAEWRDRVDAARASELVRALTSGVSDARALVKLEQDAYFRSFEKQPVVELGELLARSTAEATTTSTPLVPREEVSPERARQAVTAAEAKVAAIRTLLARTEAALSAARAAGDTVGVELHEGSRRSVHRALEQAELDAAAAAAKARGLVPR